jgi:hypothetical protein
VYKDVLKTNNYGIPLPKSFRISHDDLTLDEIERMKNVPYRNLLGSLLFIARCSRPDIMASIGILSRYCESPSERHWKALLGVLSYLVATKEVCLTFTKQANFDIKNALVAFTDSDHASCLSTRKSVSGYCVFFLGCLISWGSKQQDIIANSSTEAEYVAMNHTGMEVEYARNLLDSIMFSQKQPTDMYYDNTSANFLTQNSTTKPQTKHINIKYHRIRYYISSKIIKNIYCNTLKLLSDLFTKPLEFAKFDFFRRIVMNLDRSDDIFSFLKD